MRITRLGFSALLGLVLLVGAFIPLMAQTSETTITVAIPEWMSERFSSRLFDDFEAANPGVNVVVVSQGQDSFYPPPSADIEEHLNGTEAAVQTADVVFVSNFNISPEATAAGYFLNLAPLIQGDPSFNEADFYPAAWRAYQWDGGVWAVPMTVNLDLLIYNALAFDAANLAYPDASWTLDDLANAARTLATYDDAGEVTSPGFVAWNTSPLLVSLLGDTLYDDTIIPNQPDFSNPALVSLIEAWQGYYEDGTLGQPFGSFDMNTVPMTIDGTWRLGSMVTTPENTRWEASLLPGGRANMRTEGFAVSGGTDQPVLAYELVKYMSESADIVNLFFSERPARQSLFGVEPENDSGIVLFRPEMTPETEAVIEAGLQNATSFSDLRYVDYVIPVISGLFNPETGEPGSPPEDVPAALQEAEARARENLELAQARRDGGNVLAVATAVPTPVLGAGEISLNFRLGVPYSPLPNREVWDRVIADFVAQDPEVGNINLSTGFGGMPQDEETAPDCSYNGFANQQTFDPNEYISLDPFMDADPNFDASDFIGNSLASLQSEGRTWGYPIALQPNMISYNVEAFTNAGIPEPVNGWTIDEFIFALQTLQETGEYETVFMPTDFGSTYLFMLMVAYGAIPVDHTTNPPTYNLVANTEVIRQVLDLARDGYLSYSELDSDTFGGGGGFTINEIPLMTTTFTNFIFSLPRGNSEGEIVNPSRYTTYPTGSMYSPVAYETGAAFIHADTQNPEACYRWITAISQHPELLLGIPARRSQLDDPAFVESVSPETSETFRNIAAIIDSPNAVSLPSGFSTFNNFVEIIWVNQAFDGYVLEDGNLEEGLERAEQNIAAFRACTANYPTLSPSEIEAMTEEELRDYFNQSRLCIIQVDPELESRFPAAP